jgi:hypothetical protein
MRRWWAPARAVLITLAIVIGLADGCPVPEKKIRDRMPSGLRSTVESFNDVRISFLKPFKPIGAAAKLYQKWSLFRGASRDRFRLWIEARVGTEWTLLYRALDDDHDWHAGQMEYRRVRGGYNPSNRRGAPGAYQHFATWVADQVFAERADVEEVRVQMEQLRISDEEGATPLGTFTYVHKRSPRRAAR